MDTTSNARIYLMQGFTRSRDLFYFQKSPQRFRRWGGVHVKRNKLEKQSGVQHVPTECIWLDIFVKPRKSSLIAY